MTDKSMKELNESDLDAVTGGTDSNHTDWIPVLSVDQGIQRSSARKSDADDRPTEEVAFYYNKIG